MLVMLGMHSRAPERANRDVSSGQCIRSIRGCIEKQRIKSRLKESKFYGTSHLSMHFSFAYCLASIAVLSFFNCNLSKASCS